MINELPRALDEAGIGFGSLSVTPENFAEFVIRVDKGVISSAGAKAVLLEMVKTGADPDDVIREKNLSQLSDSAELEKVADKIIQEHPAVAEDFRKGKQNALQFLVGQVMKETKGRANPKIVQELLRKRLG